MRTYTMLFLALIAALLVNLVDTQSLSAESGKDRTAIHRKYQTSSDGSHGRSNPWQNEARYEHRRDRANDRRGDQLVWRDYRGYTAKHYQIQQRYGLYSAEAAYRADYEYDLNRRSHKGNRRGSRGAERGRR